MNSIDTFGKVFFPTNKDIIWGARLLSINNDYIIEFDFPSLKVPRKPEIILGEFTGLGLVTCVGNEVYGFHSGEGGTRCKYKVSYLFTGIHFNRIIDVKFDTAVFQINSLNDWFEIRTFTHDFFPIKMVTFEKSREIELKISGFKKPCFYFSHDFNSRRHSFEANETISLILPALKTTNIDIFYSVIIKFKKLFAFLTNSSLLIDDITLYRFKKNAESTNAKKSATKINLYDKRTTISPMPTSEFLNIKYIDIKEYFPSLIRKWTSFAEENIVIDLLMEKAYNRELSEKTYFLNICFALEIYHKSYVNDQRLSEFEFQEIKKYLRKNIRNAAAKEWINSKLGLGNRPSFRDRLTHFKKDFKEIYYTDVETLIDRIINTRNSLVHSTSKSKYTIKDDLELFLISITIETTIKAAILKRLGIEETNISKIYQTAKNHIKILKERSNSEWLI